jgi:hypothetical protein
MATYFLRALRDQEFRAHRFEQRLRWARMRRALTNDETVIETNEMVEAEQPLDNVIDLRPNPSVVLPEPRQPAGA